MNKSGSDTCPASLAAKFLQNIMERRNKLNFYLAHFEEITSLTLIPLSLPVSQGPALPYNTLTTRLTSKEWGGGRGHARRKKAGTSFSEEDCEVGSRGHGALVDA